MSELLPWLLGHGSVLQAARAKCEAAGLAPRVFEVLDPSSRDFFALLNAANQVAFGGLGMPAWVQLDCCTLPGLMVGWGAESAQLSAKVRAQVQDKLSKDAPGLQSGDEAGSFWPYSEFCGIRRGAEELVGVSTFSLAPRKGLGLRAKALGLWLSEAKTQIGMTQWDNAATALHCRFGPLRVLAAQAANHSRPEHTFVYGLDLPAPQRLFDMLCGRDDAGPRELSVNEELPLRPGIAATVQAWMSSGQQVHIVRWSPQKVGFHRQVTG